MECLYPKPPKDGPLKPEFDAPPTGGDGLKHIETQGIYNLYNCKSYDIGWWFQTC
jgi:hypothetical protein